MPRDVGADVDDGVPAAVVERAVVAGAAVAHGARHLGEQVGVGHPPAEQRHLVPGLQRGLDQRAAHERRPTQHQQPHAADRNVSRVRRVLVVQHEPECPPDHVGRVAGRRGLEVEVAAPGRSRCRRCEGRDGLVVLGGHMGANDDATCAWLPPVKGLLRDAVATGVPTLGICLGAQLLAVATGGRVEVGEAGIEAGVVGVGWRPEAAVGRPRGRAAGRLPGTVDAPRRRDGAAAGRGLAGGDGAVPAPGVPGRRARPGASSSTRRPRLRPSPPGHTCTTTSGPRGASTAERWCRSTPTGPRTSPSPGRS